MGVTSAPVFANMIGAAYGTAKSGIRISSMGFINPGLVMRSIIPVVMAVVLRIYGLIVAVVIIQVPLRSQWTEWVSIPCTPDSHT